MLTKIVRHLLKIWTKDILRGEEMTEETKNNCFLFKISKPRVNLIQFRSKVITINKGGLYV